MTIFLLFSVLYTILLIFVTVSLLLENRNPSRTLLWVFVLIFLPFVGLFFYFALGKSFRKKRIIPEIFSANTTEHSENGIIKLLLNNGKSAVYTASKIDVYSSGKETFEAMFEAIRNAKEYIYIEFFIFRNDRISNQLRELLIERAQAGVEVSLIYDYLGSFKCGKKYWKSLRKAGVQVYPFFPLSAGLSKINCRNHRKILVVDGEIGFIGGLNIADRYYFGNKLGQWRDTFVSLQGEAVCGLQNVFLSDSPPTPSGGRIKEQMSIHTNNGMPFTSPQKGGLGGAVQIVSSGPDTEWETIVQGMAVVISSAEKYVYIQTPYFVPNELIDNIIILSAMRGIDVKMMLPSVSDTPLLDVCTETYLGRLLRAGVKIYKYNGNFMHCKTIVADDNVSVIGSANLDERSFNQNFEVNAFIYDKITAEKCRQLFENDMQSCSLYTYEEWSKRSGFKKFVSSLARVLSPAL